MVSTSAKILVITVCMTLAGCTTLRPVANWEPPPAGSQPAASQPASAKGLKPGDHIIVTTTGDLKAELDFVRVTADALEGTIGKDERVLEIPRNQIMGIERREVDALKTTGAVIGVTLSTLAVLTAVAFSAGGYAAFY